MPQTWFGKFKFFMIIVVPTSKLFLESRAKVKYHSFWPAILIADPPEEVKALGKARMICVRFFTVGGLGD